MWYVYIVKKREHLYVGITSDLQNRLRQHGWPDLLYTELFKEKERAINREKQIKTWSHSKKQNLIYGHSKQ